MPSSARCVVQAVLALLLAVPCVARADGPVQASGIPDLPDRWVQGYVRTVAGEWIVYPWAYPGQTRTLLSRATDGRMAVEWEGEPVPDGGSDQPVTYLWHAGTASGYGAHRFTLTVNGRMVTSFTSGRTSDDRHWTVRGEGGVTLSFRTTRVGQFNELFGFMWLTAPRTLFGKGAPRFRVAGEAAGSQDYYLGPQERVEEWSRVRAEEAVFADGQRAVRAAISRVGPARPAVVRSGDRILWSGEAPPGYTTVLVRVGSNVATTVPITVSVGDAPAAVATLAMRAVPPRTIHLLPHSHVDIGYSDPQPEVERKQWKNLRDAVALGRATASYPPEARFKWNVEGLWSVESYLAQATASERQAFADGVRDGTIGLQANYTNLLTGLATPEELRRWTDVAHRVRTALGVGPIRSAMHSDIPGLSWAAVSALASSGVRYFSSGPNYMPGLPDGGDRIGATLKALGDRPFWWTSPSGEERLLFWMAGRGYSWFHGLNSGGASDRSRDAILDYVKVLADSQYPYDMIQVRYTVGGDNGPVDPNLADFVKRWNDTFASPRLAIDTAEAMFAEFERRHGAELPVMSGDMTPYWEDGALSSAAEEALVRAAARRIDQAERLAALRRIVLPPTEVNAAWRNVLLWHEHTWGAADSISQPDRADVMAQWDYKLHFASDADVLSRRLMSLALPKASPGAPHVAIINTLSWDRSGLVLLTPEQSRTGGRVLGDDGPLPSQRLHDGRLAVWVERVPPLSSVRLRVVPGAPVPPAQAAVAAKGVIDNGWVRLVLDADRAAVTSLTWAGAPGHDFAAGEQGLLRYLYLAGRDPADAEGTTGGTLTVEDAGPLVTTVRVDLPAGGARSSVRRFRVVAGSDRVFAEIALDKVPVRTKESGHVAFPFQVPGGVIRVDQGEALVEIERDQLPGSCRDFIGVQSAIDVSGPALGVSLVSLDAPLIELGALTDERQVDGRARTWRAQAAPGTTLYAYLFNNYWHTNYKADQSGPLSFRFVVRPHAAFDPVALRRLSDEQDFPLLAVSVDDDGLPITSPFALEGDPVVVSSLGAVAGGSALVVRLYNPSTTAAVVVVRPTATSAHRDVVAPIRTQSSGDERVTLPPRSSRTVRLSLR
ncbi:MAG: glycoside hydrolase [Acidobacteria bacterium]|nr:glycoside hydrolase [Acidobacteriota bacterium]